MLNSICLQPLQAAVGPFHSRIWACYSYSRSIQHRLSQGTCDSESSSLFRVMIYILFYTVIIVQERVAVQSLIRRVIKDEQKGFTTCQYGSKNRFKFVGEIIFYIRMTIFIHAVSSCQTNNIINLSAYLDKKPPATPTLITSIQRQFANNFSPQPMLSKRGTRIVKS